MRLSSCWLWVYRGHHKVGESVLVWVYRMHQCIICISHTIYTWSRTWLSSCWLWVYRRHHRVGESVLVWVYRMHHIHITCHIHMGCECDCLSVCCGCTEGIIELVNWCWCGCTEYTIYIWDVTHSHVRRDSIMRG